MRKLVTISILGLALAFPSVSFAQSYIFGVKTPIVKHEVADAVKGSRVESDFISFYTTPKVAEVTSAEATNPVSDDKDSYIVFGVKIDRTKEI